MHDFPCTIILTFNKNRFKKRNREITTKNLKTKLEVEAALWILGGFLLSFFWFLFCSLLTPCGLAGSKGTPGDSSVAMQGSEHP